MIPMLEKFINLERGEDTSDDEEGSQGQFALGDAGELEDKMGEELDSIEDIDSIDDQLQYGQEQA